MVAKSEWEPIEQDRKQKGDKYIFFAGSNSSVF